MRTLTWAMNTHMFSCLVKHNFGCIYLINTISEWPPNLFKHVWMDGPDSLIAQPGPQWSITQPTLVHCSTNHKLFEDNLMERSLHATQLNEIQPQPTPSPTIQLFALSLSLSSTHLQKSTELRRWNLSEGKGRSFISLLNLLQCSGICGYPFLLFYQFLCHGLCFSGYDFSKQLCFPISKDSEKDSK